MDFNLGAYTTEKLKELLASKLSVDEGKRTEVQKMVIVAIEEELKVRGEGVV